MTWDRKKVQEQVVGAIATIPTAFTKNYKVDYQQMYDATQVWIESGLVAGKSVIKAVAAMGEGPQLTETEWITVIETVVKASKNKVPVMAAIHYKDTIRTIQDANKAADVGTIALQISPPVFNQPTQDDMLRYFEAVSNNINTGILIYNTHWLTHGAIYPDTFRKMRDFEKIIGIKWSPPKGVKYEEIFDLSEVFNIVDNSNQPVRCHQLGGKGFLSDGIAAYPQYFIGIWEMLEQGLYDKAQSEWNRVMLPLVEFYGKVTSKNGGDGQVEKALSETMGLPMGPPRPPSLPLNEIEMAELKSLMTSWGWPVP
tara:strand:+ start:201 stop:1136 length:936 start_codon:yes stop_codon:yes gene_type:complete